MPSVPTVVDTEAGSPAVGPYLTDEQKRTLYRDGFIVLKGVVSRELTRAAKRRLFDPTAAERKAGFGQVGSSAEMTDLVNKSMFGPILRSIIGEFDPPANAFPAILKANSKPGPNFNAQGYKEEGFPYYNAAIHMDGLATNPVPQVVQTKPEDEIYFDWCSDRAGFGARSARWETGRSADNVTSNAGPLFQDKECTLSTGSFTSFAIVALNDQSVPGRGNFSVLRGCHHAMEQFYRMQRDVGGIVGPEGPGWPRFDHNAPNGCGLVYLPEAVQEHFLNPTSERTPDGRRWPRPTQVLVEEGDVCVTLHAIPHSGSRNEGPEPRQNIIFRIRHKKRQPGKVTNNNLNDHPDRGMLGEWLEYEEGNDPFQRSIAALCNIWDEWDGMRDIVAEMRERERASGAHPRGAGPDAVDRYKAWVAARPSRVPVTPREAVAHYAAVRERLEREGKWRAPGWARRKGRPPGAAAAAKM